MKAIFLILAVLVVGIYLYMKMIPSPIVIAHRGASYLAPEETIPAFLIAEKLGADFLEMDIQRTLDGVLIAVHDQTFERTTNISEVFPSRAKDPIGSFTWAEVQQLDSGSWFNLAFPERARSSYKGLKILSLEEIIDLVSLNSKLYIETKSPNLYPGYEQEIVDLLRKKGWLKKEKIIFQSFDLNSIIRLEKIVPDIVRIWLLEYKHRQPWREVLSTAKGIVQGLGPSGYESFPWQVIPAHRAGYFVHTWTIDKPWQMQLLKAFGVDGIFTNRSEIALVEYGRSKNININHIIESVGY